MEPDHPTRGARYHGTANAPTRSVEKGDSQGTVKHFLLREIFYTKFYRMFPFCPLFSSFPIKKKASFTIKLFTVKACL